jgi:hypothetical protein
VRSSSLIAPVPALPIDSQTTFGGAQSTRQSQHDHAAIHAVLSTMVGVVPKPQDIHNG